MFPTTSLAGARPETAGGGRTPAAGTPAAAGIPGGAFLEGQWQTHGLELPVRNPENGQILALVCVSTPEEVRAAIGHIEEHLAAGDWALRSRREALELASRLLLERAGQFAALIASEASKTIREAEREVARAAETLRLSAAAASMLAGQTLDFEDSLAAPGTIGWYQRKPVGLVAAITPFNDPLNLVAHKLGPALIAGNGVVLKPSARTPLSGLALVDLLLEAGVPSGRIAAVVSGPGVSEALTTDPRIDLISFTGDPRTADRIAAAAGAKKIVSELGGNNPTIVCADADPARAAEAIVAGAFGVAGQNCLSVQRVYIHESLFDDVVDQVARGAAALTVGPKLDRATDVGPLISEDEARRVEEWVHEAEVAGATVHVGGRRHGAFYYPTVLTGVPGHCRVLSEEVFGPVVTLVPFTDPAEAIAAANDSEYGLQAGVFTRSVDTALALAEKLHVGAVVINQTSDVRIDSMPFGGFKKSGVGREGVTFAVLEMTEPKNIIITLDPAQATAP